MKTSADMRNDEQNDERHVRRDEQRHAQRVAEMFAKNKYDRSCTHRIAVLHKQIVGREPRDHCSFLPWEESHVIEGIELARLHMTHVGDARCRGGGRDDRLGKTRRAADHRISDRGQSNEGCCLGRLPFSADAVRCCRYYARAPSSRAKSRRRRGILQEPLSRRGSPQELCVAAWLTAIPERGCLRHSLRLCVFALQP